MQLAKESIDLGITTQNPAAALAFYRDTLGFEHVGEMKLDGITVQQLMCGTSMIKLVCHDEAPPAVAPPGGPARAARDPVTRATGPRGCAHTHGANQLMCCDEV